MQIKNNQESWKEEVKLEFWKKSIAKEINVFEKGDKTKILSNR